MTRKETARSANRVYVGSRDNTGRPVVTIDARPLFPITSQRVWNHSPDGFEWGYGGSGPAQLALALLLDATDGNSITALSYYQAFKWRFVAAWPRTGWAINRSAILNWLTDQICPLRLNPPPTSEE